MAPTPSAASSLTAFSTDASSRGTSTSPLAVTRSRTSLRSAPGARNAAASGCSTRSYMAWRIWRPISSTSLKPAVMIRPIFAPLASSTALVATVVPCTKRAMAPAGIDQSRSISVIAARTPALGLLRVVGILVSRTAPSDARQTTSVKVPPMSTPISKPSRPAVIARFRC